MARHYAAWVTLRNCLLTGKSWLIRSPSGVHSGAPALPLLGEKVITFAEIDSALPGEIMRRPPASRRRVRPALATAIGCGVLGGSLVGIGALGFDKVEVAAATCVEEDAPAASTPAATPAPELPNPMADEDVVTGQPVAMSKLSATEAQKVTAANEAALADAQVEYDTRLKSISGGPLGDDTTVAPVVGPRKPICEPDPVVIPLPGGETTDPETDVPADEPGEEPDQVEDPDGPDQPAATPLPDIEDGGTAPTPIPAITPQPTPVPVVIPPVITPNPVLPAPPTTTRGFSTTSPPRNPTPSRTGTITRPEAIARAVSWVTQGVMYSQSRWWTDLNGSFRQDCSGYVAMAWRTDQRINYWTGNLGTISGRIPSSSLQPGDILLLPGKHTVIFAGWANGQRTKFHLFEEYRTGTPARFLRNASLSYYLDRGYGSHKYDGMREGVIAPTTPLPMVTPAPTPVPTPVRAPEAMNEAQDRGQERDTVQLLSAQSDSGRTTTAPMQQTWTIEQAIAGLPATDWSPGVAEDFTPDSGAFTPDSPADTAELAFADMPVQELVEAQQTVDQAEEQRLAAVSRDALATSENRTSGAGVILAAGLGLLFIAIPLGAASRRTWTPSSAAAPIAPGREQH